MVFHELLEHKHGIGRAGQWANSIKCHSRKDFGPGVLWLCWNSPGGQFSLAHLRPSLPPCTVSLQDPWFGVLLWTSALAVTPRGKGVLTGKENVKRQRLFMTNLGGFLIINCGRLNTTAGHSALGQIELRGVCKCNPDKNITENLFVCIKVCLFVCLFNTGWDQPDPLLLQVCS